MYGILEASIYKSDITIIGSFDTKEQARKYANDYIRDRASQWDSNSIVTDRIKLEVIKL